MYIKHKWLRALKFLTLQSIVVYLFNIKNCLYFSTQIYDCRYNKSLFPQKC